MSNIIDILTWQTNKLFDEAEDALSRAPLPFSGSDGYFMYSKTDGLSNRNDWHSTQCVCHQCEGMRYDDLRKNGLIISADNSLPHNVVLFRRK